MRIPWLGLRWLAVLVLGTIGCRSGPPETKPAPQPQVLRLPPSDEARYNYPTMPKEAMASSRDPSKKSNDPLQPGRAAFGPRGGPGMGANGF